MTTEGGGDLSGYSIPGEGALLGIDPGTKRVGVATVRALEIVHPLGFLDAQPRELLLEKIRALARERDCVGIVVGLPINMNGTEGKAAKAARELGEAIRQHCGLPVDYCDERLTSFSAERDLEPLGLTRKKQKARVDAVAAATMLATYLAQRRLDAAQSAGEDAPETDPHAGA